MFYKPHQSLTRTVSLFRTKKTWGLWLMAMKRRDGYLNSDTTLNSSDRKGVECSAITVLHDEVFRVLRNSLISRLTEFSFYFYSGET